MISGNLLVGGVPDRRSSSAAPQPGEVVVRAESLHARRENGQLRDRDKSLVSFSDPPPPRFFFFFFFHSP